MKANILLSTLAASALLLTGCNNDTGTASGAGTESAKQTTNASEGGSAKASTSATAQKKGDTAASGSTKSGTITGAASGTQSGGSADKAGNSGSMSHGNSSGSTDHGEHDSGSNHNNHNNHGDTDSGNSNSGDTSNGDNENNGDNTSDGLIPGPGDNGNIPAPTSEAGGWYGRTVVSATAPDGTLYKHSTAGVFGELVDSDEAIDDHDIPAFGTSIFKVVFPQGDAGNSDEFFSNYQGFDKNGNAKRSWTFQIKNQKEVDLKDAPIKIELPEIHKVSYKKVNGRIIYDKHEILDNSKASELTLIDVDKQKSYTVEELKTANLTMDGKHTRTFKWVLGSVESDDYNSPLVSNDINSNGGDVTSDEVGDIAAIQQKSDFVSAPKTVEGGKFGLPPM